MLIDISFTEFTDYGELVQHTFKKQIEFREMKMYERCTREMYKRRLLDIELEVELKKTLGKLNLEIHKLELEIAFQCTLLA